jgi:hypothetical protein
MQQIQGFSSAGDFCQRIDRSIGDRVQRKEETKPLEVSVGAPRKQKQTH